jgi:hypothetical protein
MNTLAPSLAPSPELFPHSLDLRADAIGFIRLDEAGCRAASFLDERILRPTTVRHSMGWTEADRALDSAGLRESCHFIFHVGHVGSTLVSRLLGGLEGVFALREPAVLRTLAQIRAEAANAPPVWVGESYERRTATLLKLLSRTFRPEDRAVIKATSFVSELAPEWLSRPEKPRAILMFVSPESYLATILGGENAPQEARALAPSRLVRLKSRLGAEISRLESLTIGEVVAMSWACEMTALVAAKRSAGERALLFDFDAFLCDPHTLLLHAVRHLDIAASPDSIHSVITGPDMRRYSKAPEHAYDANLRRDVLNQARALSGDDIKCGRSWLDALARDHRIVAEAMSLVHSSARP